VFCILENVVDNEYGRRCGGRFRLEMKGSPFQAFENKARHSTRSKAASDELM
jgi:hypothetical protein